MTCMSHVDMHIQDYSCILEVISDHPSCQGPLVFQQLYKAYAIVSLSPPSYMQLCYLSKLVVTGTTSKAEKGLSVLCCLVHRHATLKLVYKFFIFLIEHSCAQTRDPQLSLQRAIYLKGNRFHLDVRCLPRHLAQQGCD